MNQRQIVEKTMITVADLVSDGGYLNPEQADKFLRDVQDAPTLLNDVRFVRMNAPKRVIENVGFGSRILKAAPASGTALGSANRSAPTTGKITLTTEEVIAEIRLPYDVLEDNIERANFEGSVMSMIAERVALDLGELMVLGDDASGDEYLALFDGALQMATSHTASIAGDNSAVSKNIFKQAILEMPTKYLRNRSAMKFYISPDNETEYRDIVADRQTGYGDSTLTGNSPVMVFGVDIKPDVHVPDTKLILVDPKNLIFGVQRQIQIETDRVITERVIVIVVTLRVAIGVETEDALTVITGIGE